MLENAIGKKLKAVVNSYFYGTILLAFEDGSIYEFSADRGYGDDSPEVTVKDSFDWTKYSKEELLASGVIDEEFIRQREEEEQQRKEQAKQQELVRRKRLYESLKQEFEQCPSSKSN